MHDNYYCMCICIVLYWVPRIEASMAKGFPRIIKLSYPITVVHTYADKQAYVLCACMCMCVCGVVCVRVWCGLCVCEWLCLIKYAVCIIAPSIKGNL